MLRNNKCNPYDEKTFTGNCSRFVYSTAVNDDDHRGINCLSGRIGETTIVDIRKTHIKKMSRKNLNFMKNEKN